MQIDISNFRCEIVPMSGEITLQVTPDGEKHLLYWGVMHLLRLGVKANPKVAFLAYHAKTQRARIKNLKRLYKLGCLVEKRGGKNAQ